MDRRSWLWRRKSSEKTPGESESSGSISSDRFLDDQAYPAQGAQSPEVSCKTVLHEEEEVNDNVKVLTEKLSAALLNIGAKEDLAKQHAKVAEEAVSGWEKAETEVTALRKQLEAANHRNSALEDRVVQLDGALKECMRQLRQAREDQDQKIHDAVAEKISEWESKKSIFESQLAELQAQVQTARTEAAAIIGSEFRLKLEAVEKENSKLKIELLSLGKELQNRMIERDLSTQAAEIASKQHLESIKRMAKLEAECRRLKAMVRKASLPKSQKSFSASFDCYKDSQSDVTEGRMSSEDSHRAGGSELDDCESNKSNSLLSSLEREKPNNGKEIGQKPSVNVSGIHLMDDFLEMEKLAALTSKESPSCRPEVTPSAQSRDNESSLKSQLEVMTDRMSRLEGKIENMELEKVELEMALKECQNQLETTQSQLVEAKVKLVELHAELDLLNELKQTAEEEAKAIKTERDAAESQILVAEAELETLLSKLTSLEEEIDKERALSAASFAKCRELEDELSRRDKEPVLENEKSKLMQEKELALAADKFAECQKTIASLGRQLKALATLEDFLIGSEQPLEPNGGMVQSDQNGVD